MNYSFLIVIRLVPQREMTSNPEIVRTRDPSTGYTVLHWAARFGFLIYLYNFSNWIKIYVVCLRKGNTGLIHQLIGRHGMDVNLRTRGGYTPLMLAAIHGKISVYNMVRKFPLVKMYLLILLLMIIRSYWIRMLQIRTCETTAGEKLISICLRPKVLKMTFRTVIGMTGQKFVEGVSIKVQLLSEDLPERHLWSQRQSQNSVNLNSTKAWIVFFVCWKMLINK